MKRNFRQNLRKARFALMAISVGLMVHLAVFVPLSFESRSVDREKIREAFVQYPDRREGEHSVLLKEQASLFDSAPLFLPTPHNHSFSLKEIRMQEEETTLFDSFPAKITLSRLNWEAFSWFEKPGVSDYRGVLRSEFWNIFHYLGSSPRSKDVETKRGSWIEIVPYGRSTPTLVEPLPIQIRQAGEGVLWSPVALRILVDRIGPIGAPLLVNSSGSYRVDEAIERYLLEAARDWGLRPGYYKVLFGP
ncbi:MAG: hypothetical protein DF168_00531 [Candidatus Moanabacter tarae]|uniref:Uncharacterized protein n=1 Tax=Candidatus Moanibacter tarae TaxID=2200854 RepID=A0A2Z4AEI2_9BACT|nr:MAG: hypothetical protein DF168_00531 [Candidatus Moanabacter tarae]|tara:strand:+ start:15948 stop:16691 length:744 start_codon:yes stop_codon:yes gene_type:complete